MTTFKTAETPEDYKAAHSLMIAESFPEQALDFPTVMAFKANGELIGMLTTNLADEMVVAGPLVMRSDIRRSQVAFKLVEAYEAALRKLGIVSYIFSVDKGSIVHKAATRILPDMPAYAKEGDKSFFIRRLDEDGKQGLSSRSER